MNCFSAMKLFFLLIFGTVYFSHLGSALNITTVDFTQNAIVTTAVMWNNIVGLSMNIQYVQQYMNSTLFQQYLLNSNTYGNWGNNWAVSLKVPKGFRYGCAALQNSTNVTIDCTTDSSLNSTFYDILGQYIWNTVNQPYWCIGYSMQGVDLKNQVQAQQYFNWLLQVFTSTYSLQYCDQIIDWGDKAVQQGYKTGQYTAADFIDDITSALDITTYIWHSGPGITEDAHPSWMAAVEDFSHLTYGGHYTVRCVIFKDIAQATIPNLLSDQYTKLYLTSRFVVNSTFSWTSFNNYPLGINDIRLTTGKGVDGVTNSFAATLWAIDFIFQFSLYQPYQIDFNNDLQTGNFQTVFGPGPQFKPNSLYYALLFTSLMIDSTPTIILPSQILGISQNIKAWGLQTTDYYKFVLINKDINASLNGVVYVKSYLSTTASCIYLQAPSLSQKTNITIGGYNFVANNSNPQGTYKTFNINYDQASSSYAVPLKYAQAVICQITNTGASFPTGKFQINIKFSFVLVLMILIMSN